MKRCPECRRDYYDETLLYCLDDGAALLEGPSTAEPTTAILTADRISSEQATRSFGAGPATNASSFPGGQAAPKKNAIVAGIAGIILLTAAIHHAALGERDAAFAELEKAFQNRDYFLPRLKVDPFMDPPRDDPRYDAMVKRLNLP